MVCYLLPDFAGRLFGSVLLTGLFLLMSGNSVMYAQAPLNDSCLNAVSITPNPVGYHQLYPVSDSTVNATTSDVVPSCNAGTGGRKDVWYQFIAVSTTHRLVRQHTAIGVGTATPGIAVYHADDCLDIGSATEIYCSAIGTTIDLTGLTIGDTYYIQLYANGTGNPNFRYTLWVGTPPAAATNDECAGAIDISDGSLYTGETDAATQSLPSSDCGWGPSSTAKDIWYSFTAIQAGDLTLSVISDPYEAHVLQVFNSCTSTASPIACKDEGPLEVTIPGLSSGQTIVARVHGFDNDGPFTIQTSGTALPVSQGPLAGKVLENGTIALQWETYKEESNRGFAIERSADAKNFTAVGYVTSLSSGNDNAQAPFQYRWQDLTAPSGNLFYRLRQVDLDGKEALSNIVNLYKPGVDLRVLSAYMDQQGQLDVSTNGVNDVGAQLYLFDMNGKAIRSMRMPNTTLKMNIGGLAAGIYLLHYQGREYTIYTKIVLR